jgi:hypothetical protein
MNMRLIVRYLVTQHLNYNNQLAASLQSNNVVRWEVLVD